MDKKNAFVQMMQEIILDKKNISAESWEKIFDQLQHPVKKQYVSERWLLAYNSFEWAWKHQQTNLSSQSQQVEEALFELTNADKTIKNDDSNDAVYIKDSSLKAIAKVKNILTKA